MTEITLYIKQWRLVRGYTQQQLAEKADTSREYLNAIERGKHVAGEQTLEKICKALDVSITRLRHNPFDKAALQ